MYCIGDVVCCLFDGGLEFFGCSDDQVKICGFCVELGEIVVVFNGYYVVYGCYVMVCGYVSGFWLMVYVVGGL